MSRLEAVASLCERDLRTICCILLSASLFSGVLAAQDGPAKLRQTLAELAAGRYPATIQAGVEAIAIFRKSGDRAGEGRALNAVGLAELYSGDYSLALPNFNSALSIARETADGDAEITQLNNLGTLLYFQGRYAGAMERYQEAMARVQAYPNERWTPSRRNLTLANIAILYQTLGQFERALDLYTELLKSPQALPLREQAQVLTNVGALRRRLGDPRKALDTYRAAQALYMSDAHRDGEIGVLNNIGIVQAMDLGEFANATGTFTQALNLAEKSGNRPLAVHARLYRGETLYRAGLLARSASDFQAAADEANALGELEEGWKALYGLARIAAGSGDAPKADQLLNRAVGMIESLRASLGGSALSSGFLADKRDVYDLLIEHTLKIDDVFRWMEQSRARTLQDRLRPAALRGLSDFARGLPPGTAVLEYWWGRSSAAVLWISALETGMKRWNISSADNKGVAALPALLASPEREDWRAVARPASEQLLAGIPPLQRAGIRHITIVPDGPLARIPFEALPIDVDKSPSLLIERFTVSYSPSAGLIPEQVKSGEIRWPWQQIFEGFADPSHGQGVPGAELTPARAWPGLPEAVREVNGIARMLRGRSVVHAGPQALKVYLERSPRAPLLHFATHAFADMQSPDRSYLLLAPATRSQRSDYLFLKEVYSLPLKGVNLVTASACETDAGKRVPGEGVESFSRAFLAAGAESVVTSLWKVGDRSSAELMLRFYSGLAAGKTKAAALRAAKLDFLHSPSGAHPAHWAAFVLNGDSDAGIPYVVGWIWLWVPLAVLLGVGFLIGRIRKRAGKV